MSVWNFCTGLTPPVETFALVAGVGGGDGGGDTRIELKMSETIIATSLDSDNAITFTGY